MLRLMCEPRAWFRRFLHDQANSGQFYSIFLLDCCLGDIAANQLTIEPIAAALSLIISKIFFPERETRTTTGASGCQFP